MDPLIRLLFNAEEEFATLVLKAAKIYADSWDGDDYKVSVEDSVLLAVGRNPNENKTDLDDIPFGYPVYALLSDDIHDDIVDWAEKVMQRSLKGEEEKEDEKKQV